MDFKNWLLSEMPINKFDLVGDWGEDAPKRGWDNKSIGILKNEKGVQRIKNKWNATEIDFDMYFVRHPKGKNFVQVGEVNSEWLQQNLQINLNPNPQSVTILFTQNTGDEKIPMTYWTIGHRLGHALLIGKGHTAKLFKNFFDLVRKEMSELFKIVYNGEIDFHPNSTGRFQDANNRVDNNLKILAHALGTMKSARDGKLRNISEFMFELFGQYILNGKIRFNMPPEQLGTKTAWGRKSPLYINNMQTDFEKKEIKYSLEFMEDQFNQLCEEIINSAVGKIFVM